MPVPIHITYDVPNRIHFEEEPASLMGNEKHTITGFAQSRLENTSFTISPDRLITQAVTPEQFSIRLHAPSVRSLTHILFAIHIVGNSSAVIGRRRGGREALGARQ